MSRLSSVLLGGVMMMTALIAGPALADDPGFKTKHAGDILIRLRAVGVLPSDGDTIKFANGNDTGLRTRVDNNYIPELDASYFITDNIAVEAIAGWTKHSVKASNGTTNVANAGDVYLLPPTITAQWHFFHDQRVSPYVGAGINYTILFGESGGDVGVRPVKFGNSFGPALQAGVDFALTGNWSLNFDVKKIWISTDYTLAGGALKGTADLNPWLVGFGVGYRF